jgi:hypothetical protein
MADIRTGYYPNASLETYLYTIRIINKERETSRWYIGLLQSEATQASGD